jgi:uncharacterized protein (UPF0333 family)
MTIGSIDSDELKRILTLLKNKKSPGNNGMNTEPLKYAPIETEIRFLNIINICWSMYKVTDQWMRGVIYPIFKKGNRQDCNN